MKNIRKEFEKIEEEEFVEGYTVRGLSQQIRRRMTQKDHGDKKKFSKKQKHKRPLSEEGFDD